MGYLSHGVVSRQLSHGVAEVVYAALIASSGGRRWSRQLSHRVVGRRWNRQLSHRVVGRGWSRQLSHRVIGRRWNRQLLYRVVGQKWSRQLSHRVEVGVGVGSSRIEWRSEVE